MDTNSLFSLFQEWGSWILQINLSLLLIIICSIVAAAVFFERLVYLKKTEVDTASLIIQLRKSISDGNVVEAINTCEETPGAVANIIKAGLCKHDKTREQIEYAMELRGLVEIANMEKNAKVLSIVAHVAPLIGLLGTVLGFIKAFGEMRVSSLVEISATQIGEAMEYALITTAAGLVVAIPSVIAYNYIVSRIEAMTVDMQVTSGEVIDILER